MDTRTRVLTGTVLAQLGLGTVYSWSILNPALADRYDTKTFSIAMTFSIMMICLSVSTLTINWLQAKFGIRTVLMSCGVALALGLFVSAFVPNVIVLYLTAGVVVGAADGIGYLLSLTNCLRWYPEKSGTISGICVGAYGLPAFILPLVVTPVLGDADNGYKGLTTCFILWAIIAGVLIVGGGLLLKDAPVVPAKDNAGSGEYTIPQMLRRPQAYLLFWGITAFCFAGLFIIGNAGNAASDAPDPKSYLIGTTITLVSLVALANTAGRFLFGWLSDHVSRTLIVAVSLTVLAVMSVVIGVLWRPEPWLYILGFLLFGAAFGGCITIYPTIVGDYFGHNNQSKNYSVIYQGFACGAVITLIFNTLMSNDVLEFGTALLIGCVFLAIGAVILYLVKAPGPPPQEAAVEQEPARPATV
jgi:OFA family oxalate/formate antiporter-like MFS transporter